MIDDSVLLPSLVRTKRVSSSTKDFVIGNERPLPPMDAHSLGDPPVSKSRALPHNIYCCNFIHAYFLFGAPAGIFTCGCKG